MSGQSSEQSVQVLLLSESPSRNLPLSEFSEQVLAQSKSESESGPVLGLIELVNELSDLISGSKYAYRLYRVVPAKVGAVYGLFG